MLNSSELIFAVLKNICLSIFLKKRFKTLWMVIYDSNLQIIANNTNLTLFIMDTNK